METVQNKFLLRDNKVCLILSNLTQTGVKVHLLRTIFTCWLIHVQYSNIYHFVYACVCICGIKQRPFLSWWRLMFTNVAHWWTVELWHRRTRSILLWIHRQNLLWDQLVLAFSFCYNKETLCVLICNKFLMGYFVQILWKKLDGCYHITSVILVSLPKWETGAFIKTSAWS